MTADELARFSPKYAFTFEGNHATGVAPWGIILTSKPTNKYTDFYPEDYSYVGKDQPHNNMQPYQTIYVFKRTA